MSKELYNKINIKNKYIGYVNKDELKNSLSITNNVLSINKVYSIDKESAKYVNYLHMIDKGLTISDYSFIDYINNVFVNSVDSVFGDIIDYKKFNVFGSGAFKTKDAVMVLGG